MSTDSGLLTSPWGEIQFMALSNKVKKTPAENSPMVYTVRLRFDSSNAAGVAWKETISKINPNLIGTTHVNSSTEFTVRAATQFDVILTDADGNELEEKPSFYAGSSSGSAKMVVSPYTKNKVGGTINLIAVALSDDFDAGEASSSSRDRASILAALRDAAK